MRNVLFLESGTSNGGSFECLYQIVRGIDRSRFRPMVGYVNNTHYLELVRSLDVPTYLLTDTAFSRHANVALRTVARGGRHFVRKYIPGVNLEFTKLVHGSLVQQVVEFIKRENIEILHLNDGIYRDMFGVLAAERTGVACISHLRSKDGEYLDRRSALHANRTVTAYIAISRFVNDYWVNKGLEPSKIVVLHDAIDEDDVAPLDVATAFGLPGNPRVIGCVGRLVWWKGHAFMLRAFAQVLRHDRDAVLVLVGDGPEKRSLERLTTELGVGNRVVFTGYQAGGIRYIGGFDVLVVPSLEEPFGMVLLEGMKAGTPIVATNSGGIPEIVQNGANGLMVEYGDVEKLSEAMLKLLQDSDLGQLLVRNGKRIVRERFGLRGYMEALETLYERCCEERR